jgi:hypothetical protein
MKNKKESGPLRRMPHGMKFDSKSNKALLQSLKEVKSSVVSTVIRCLGLLRFR